MEQQQLSNGKKIKNWCITINNPVDEDIQQFKDIEEFTAYYIYGAEVGASGTRHLQCYICFKGGRTLPGIKRLWPRAHFEVANGTPQQASDYCKKDGKYQEFGTLPAARNVKGGEATQAKWKQIVTFAKEQKMLELAEQHPREFITNYRGLKQIGFDFNKAPADLDEPCGEWLVGESGAGKSFTARKENPGFYLKMMNKWWDNYKGEDVVILEDLDPSYEQSMQYFLKIWSDAYAFPVEIKNHCVNIRPKKFVVTSQYRIEELFKDKKIIEALQRRFKVRVIQRLPEFDLSKSKKKIKRKAHLEKMNEIIKKPKMFKQVNGQVALNTAYGKPVTPNIFESLLEAASQEAKKAEVIDLTSLDSNTNDWDIYTDAQPWLPAEKRFMKPDEVKEEIKSEELWTTSETESDEEDISDEDTSGSFSDSYSESY